MYSSSHSSPDWKFGLLDYLLVSIVEFSGYLSGASCEAISGEGQFSFELVLVSLVYYMFVIITVSVAVLLKLL